MNNRVYYGEYSLAYWIELILTKKIVLPKYQRHFVWEPSDVREFVDSLKEKRFVPPVTIGSFSKNGIKQNLIIDGQQRLTSVLLAYLEIFPDKEQYKAHLASLANGDEDETEEGYDPFDNVLLWNFEKLTEKGSYKEEILSKLESENYKPLQHKLSKEELKQTFIGFSYIVPADDDSTAQQEFYSKIFRNINQKGVRLFEIESRKALYFLNDYYEGFFEPQFADDYFVKLTTGVKQQFDFVRYMSMLCAYHKQGQKIKKVARGYGRYMEKYYEDYIYSIIEKENGTEDGVKINKYEELFGKFEDLFENNLYSDEMNRLADTLKNLGIPKSHPSIISMDLYFFGLLYQVLFLHNDIDMSKKEQLKKELEEVISVYRKDDKHSTVPAQLGFLRLRISKSLEVYSSFVKNE